MPRDLPDLLGDALPRDAGAPDLGAIESRVARRRAGRLGGAVLALAAAVAVAVQVLPLSPPAPMIDQVEDAAPDGTTVLPLPPAGEVAAAHANGRPVFVVHDDDGEVRVLDAISPHDSTMPGLKVLAYCSRSGWFEDLWHGSKFAGNGAWRGGPAPYGLAEHTVVSTTAETVTVGTLAAAPSRQARRGEEPMGQHCTDVSGDNEDYAALVLHDPATEGATPGLLYPEVRDGELVLPDEPQVPLGGPDATLPLPAPGEVNADHVNGRPAFVRNDGDGNVLVLDAVDPHVTEFGPKVLAWCRRGAATLGEPRPGGTPIDLWYASSFAARGGAFGTGAGGVSAGGWTGGPAPTGLGRLPVRTVTANAVTVAGSPLPPPPRVGNTSIGGEGCSEAVSLFPGWPAADPTILDDLVLHEPLFPDDWWYPTPARILGEEPGLPPDELARYLEETGLDPDGLGDLDLAELPALGDTGLAVQRDDGVELLALDGTSHGLLRGASLATEPRDGHGGPVLLPTPSGRALWVDPNSGTTLAADDTTVLRGNEALVDRGDGTHESLTAYGPAEDGPTVVPGPLRVSNGHRLVSGPDCLMNAGTACQDGSRFIDTDMGGVGTTTPGCNPTDGFADFNLVSTCWLSDDTWLEVATVGAEDPVRIDVPRYPDQPDDQPTIGVFRDAVFGGPGVVAQLSLECEVPAVVGFEPDGTPVDLWGGAAWSDGPTSSLLGTAVLPGGDGPVPLVQVAAAPCGDINGVSEGVWAITDKGPTQLNDVADPVMLWTHAGANLDEIGAHQAAAAAARERVCTEAPEADLDGDGNLDRVLLGTVAQLVLVCVDGTVATLPAGGPIEAGQQADLDGDGDIELLVGGTSVSEAFVDAIDWRIDELQLIRFDEDRDAGLSLRRGIGGGPDGWSHLTEWGCRDGASGRQVIQVIVRRDGDEAEVTIHVVQVREGVATTVDERTESRPAGDPGLAGEGLAGDVLRELGSEPAFTQATQEGCLPP